MIANRSAPITASQQATRDLDTMDLASFGRGTTGSTPSRASLSDLVTAAAQDVPGIATAETVLDVFDHNPDTMLEIRRCGAGDAETKGLIAFLPLNEDGDRALFDGRLDTVNPAIGFICRQNEVPASIYIWGIWVSPRLAGGVAHVMDRLSSRKYRDATLYCKAANDKAHHFFLTLGFSAGTSMHGRFLPELLHYQRRSQPAVPSGDVKPAYDTFRPGSATGASDIGIKVVHTIEEMMQIFAVRSAAYIGEQGVPYNEDVDGNDFTGSHLIGYVGTEPAACLRIRYFADFVKVERLAVMPRFRTTPIARMMIKAGIAFAQAKGYSRFYGQAEESIYPIWKRYGFQARDTEPLRYLTERTYLEGDLVTDRLNDHISAHSGGYVLLRPEGQWDRPARLETNSFAGRDRERPPPS